MTQFLPYVIMVGVIIVFFIVCYIMFSKPKSEKKQLTKAQERRLRARNERAAAFATLKSLNVDEDENLSDTAPVPKISNVKVHEREEDPNETSFVTTKGEAVRRDGEILYEETPHKAARSLDEDKDITRVLSREEVLAAMEKADKSEADISDETAELPLSGMAAVVAADLASKNGETVAAVAATTAQGTTASFDMKTDQNSDMKMDHTRRMEPVHVDTAVMTDKVAVPPTTEEETKVADVSPWGNNLSSGADTDNSLWDKYNDASDSIIQQCVDHFLAHYGVITPAVKLQTEQITIAAFRRVGCITSGDRERVVSSLVNQESLQNVQKAYSAHPEDYIASMALRSFFDVVHCSHTSTRHLVAIDTLKVLPYLSRGHYQILALLLIFLYSRNSNNVDAKSFQNYIDKYILPFMDRFPTERSYFQQLEYLRCTALESKETRFAEILSESYPLLFRYRGFTDKELRGILHGHRIPSQYVVESFNSQLSKLALVDEGMATRFFREAGIADRGIQEQILRLAKRRPATFSGEEALDIMEEISPVLADLGDLWDSTLLRVSTLSLLGLYLAQGYVKETIGEDFDLSRWFD